MMASRRIAFVLPFLSAVPLGCSSSSSDTPGAGGFPAVATGGTGNPGGQMNGGGVPAAGAAAGAASGVMGGVPGSGGAVAAGGGAPGSGGFPSGGAPGAGGSPIGGSAGVPSNGGSSGAASGGAGGDSGGAAGAAGAGGSDNDCPGITPLAVGDHSYTIMSANGLTYQYILTIPKSIVLGKKAPVNIVWHALSSSPEEARSLTPIDAVSEAAKTITVFPRSPDMSWDAGSCCTTIVNGKRRDETVFAKELIKDFESKVCVDTHRVYTSGFSNGGMLSQMLACKMADVFAAAAPMGSTLTIPADQCTPSRPIPIFMINGTADPLVGYTATAFAGGIPVPQAFQKWSALDMCTGMPMTTLQKGKATCSTYSQCAVGTQVTLCSVEGMGHCVPGMKTESATNCLTKSGIPLGMPNNDIDGIQMSADFLAKYTLP